MPEHANNHQVKQLDDQRNTSVREDSDEVFEYFSDKEEAEKHKKEKQKS